MYFHLQFRIVKVGKFHPITCHEDTEREQRFSSTLSLASLLDAGGWFRMVLRENSDYLKQHYSVYFVVKTEYCCEKRRGILHPEIPLWNGKLYAVAVRQ